jgi:hypothetical protein
MSQRDNDGHQRSTADYPKLRYGQRKRRDQRRFSMRSLDGMQALSVSAFEYRWQHPEGLGQVLGFADLDVSRQAIQALICEEGEPCGVACCCW